MAKKSESYNNIKSLVEESIKEGLKEKDLISAISPYWFRSFHYKNDPLESFNAEIRFTEEKLGLFVNRKAEIKIISRYIGSAKNFTSNLHITIIGSTGCGKHTTFKIICKIVENSFPDIKIEFYSYYGFNYIKNRELSDDLIFKIDNTELDVRILSCSALTKPFLSKRIKKYKKNTKLLISIWNTCEYSIRSDILVNKEIFFRNYTKNEVIEIFKRRIDNSLTKEQNSSQYFNILEKDILPRLTSFSGGNLRIAFIIFKVCHLEARIKGMDIIELEFFETFLEKYMNLKNLALTNKEIQILRYSLFEGLKFITTSKLVEGLISERTVAWKYLERLTKKGALYKHYGNPSKYEIKDIFLSIYEEKIKREIIFKE